MLADLGQFIWPDASQGRHGSVSINTRSPLAHGVTNLVSGASLLDHASMSPLTTDNTGGIGSTYTPYGQSFSDISGSGPSVKTRQIAAQVNARNPWTIFALIVVSNAVNAANTTLIRTADGGGATDRNLGLGFSGAFFVSGSIVDGGTTFTVSHDQTIPYDAVLRPISAVVSCGGGVLRCFYNGVKGATDTTVTGNGYGGYSDPVNFIAGSLGTVGYRIVIAGRTDGIAWGAAEAQEFYRDPMQLLSGPMVPFPVGITGTISRPGTDVSVAGWSFTAASLSASINEATRDDASYTQAPYGVAGAITTLDLPLVAGSYTLSFAGQYLAANASSGQFRFTALDSSNTSLGVTSWQAVTATATRYDISLTVAGGTATRLKIEIQA